MIDRSIGHLQCQVARVQDGVDAPLGPAYSTTDSYPEPRRLRDAPAWCPLFLDEMFRQAVRHRRCNARLAAELSGITRDAAYKYRESPGGRWFRVAWDLIVLDARTRHANHR